MRTRSKELLELEPFILEMVNRTGTPTGGGAGVTGAGVTDHGALTGLTDDDHSVYFLLAGRSADQVAYGSVDSAGTLTLAGTSHATPGDVFINKDGGNVGIGTASPETQLHVIGDAQVERSLLPTFIAFNSTASDADGGRIARLSFRGTHVDTTKSIHARIAGVHDGAGADSKGRLEFFTSNGSGLTKYMELDNAGNLGIGTTGPGAKLHVEDNVTATVLATIENLSTDAAGHATLLVQTGDSAAGDPKVTLGSTGGNSWSIGQDNDDGAKFKISDGVVVGVNDYLTIDTLGNVGIGTTAPDSALDVSNGNIYIQHATNPELLVYNTTDTNADGGRLARIRFRGDQADASQNDMAYIQNVHDGTGADAKARLEFLTHNGTSVTKHMELDSAGNLSVPVGTGAIGIATPDGTLHVHTATAGTVTANVEADDLVVENNANAGISILTPNSGGGKIAFGDPEDNDVGLISYSHSNNAMAFWTNASEIMRITGGGQVGINTTTTTEQLTVVGAAHITSFVQLTEIAAPATPAANRVRIYPKAGGKLYSKDDAGTEYDLTDSGIGGSGASNQAAFFTGTSTIAGDNDFYWDNSAKELGLGTTSPDGRLHVHTATAGTVTANTEADDLVVENDATAGISILTPSTFGAKIAFGDPDDNDAGLIEYNHSNNAMAFWTNASEIMRITGGGQVGINTTTTSEQLTVVGGAHITSYLQMTEIAAPGTPAANRVRIYPKAGGKVYSKDDAGTEYDLTAGAAADADTLDGLDSLQFLRSDVDDTMAGVLDFGSTATAQKLQLYKSGNTRYGFGIQSNEMRIFCEDTVGARLSWGVIDTTDGTTYTEKMRLTQAAALTVGGNTVWHAGNDGAGSGLDADLLDGKQETAFVLVDGSRALTANWDAGGFEIRAETFESDVTTGTAPLTVASTTLVTNLNADLLDGKQEAAFVLVDGSRALTANWDAGGFQIRASQIRAFQFRADSATDPLVVESAGPSLELSNTTHEDVDGGRTGYIQFDGQRSGGEQSSLGIIRFVHDGAADDDKGRLEVLANNGTTTTKYLTLDSAGLVGLGTASPDGRLHVHTATAGTVTANTEADDLVVENDATAGISILTPRQWFA